MGRKLTATLLHGGVVYEAGTDESDVVGADTVTADVWDGVRAEPDPDPGPELFDPSDRDVAEVNTYLDEADGDERARVLAAEADGKARKGILEGPHGSDQS